jgi:hypothetical protein
MSFSFQLSPIREQLCSEDTPCPIQCRTPIIDPLSDELQKRVAEGEQDEYYRTRNEQKRKRGDYDIAFILSSNKHSKFKPELAVSIVLKILEICAL